MIIDLLFKMLNYILHLLLYMSEELRRLCGVVAVPDDGFCGFWCLAHLLKLDLPRALEKVTRELDSSRERAANARAQGRHPSVEA